MSEIPDLTGSVLDGVATGKILGTGDVAGVTESLAGAMLYDNSFLEFLRVQKPRRNQISLRQWQEFASVLEKLRIRFRHLYQDEILQGRAIYDDFSSNNMPSDSSGWITANRMNTSEILYLAEKLSQFLATRKEAFQERFMLQYNSQHDAARPEEGINNIQGDELLKQDLTQIAVIFNLIDQVTVLSSLEKEQLCEQVSRLLKPEELNMVQFNDVITK